MIYARKPSVFSLNRKSKQSLGLVGWWPGSPGQQLRDRSEFAFAHGSLVSFASPGTFTSGWAWGVGGGRSALAFDGVNDGVELVGKSSFYYFLSTTPFTGAVWIYPGTMAGAYGTVVATRTAVDGSGWFLYYVKTDGTASNAVVFGYEGNNLSFHFRYSATSSVPVGAWTHIAFSRDSTNTIAGTKLYINGKSVAGTEVTSGTPDNPVFTAQVTGIGRNPQASALEFQGLIEDLKIWNRTLSDNEVWSLYDPRTRWDLRFSSRLDYLKAIAAAPPIGQIITGNQAVRAASFY